MLDRINQALLIQKIENKLASLKSKYLSFDGRLVLINSVIIFLLLYYLSIYPGWVVSKIEKLKRSFLWSSTSSSSVLVCKVSWITTCLRTDEGGLKIKDIKQLNMALLAKQDWRYIMRDRGMWRRQVKLTYHKKVKLSGCWKSLHRSSKFRKDVVNSLNAFYNKIYYKVGNGKATTFWNDSWVCEASLKIMFPLVYDCCLMKNGTMPDYFNFWTNSWKIISTNNAFNDFQQQPNLLRSLLGLVALSNKDDEIQWRQGN